MMPAPQKILSFDYLMRFDYGMPVDKEFFTIKGLPKSNNRQEISVDNITICPAVPYSEGCDSFGNLKIYGCVKYPHSSFEYHISGRAVIKNLLYEEEASENMLPLYRHPYGMNKSGENLRKYFMSLKSGLEENDYVNAVSIMHMLHRDFSYRKGSTDSRTTAEEAWSLGAGVCQDYAHIFIALCRLAGIPARYVTGLITGEGESHAWAEIFYRGRWIGMDPTNDLLVADSHVKLGHGRDASDCLINRGILRGAKGSQSRNIKVIVTEE